MRSAGIDYGDSRIGIALSDPSGIMAHPHKTISARATLPESAVLIAQELKKCHPLKQIIIGLPLLLSGKDSPLCIKVRSFAELLKEFFPEIPIVLWDERLTTAGVERSLRALGVSRKKRSKVIDSLAAASILQNYLDWENQKR